MIYSVEEARSASIKSRLIKNMPGWLRAKFLKQPEKNTVEKTSIFAGQQLSIHNL